MENKKLYAVVDLETSGLDSSRHEIIQVSGVKFDDNFIVRETFDAYIKVDNVDRFILNFIHVSQRFLDMHGKSKIDVLSNFQNFIDDVDYVIGHNFKSFDAKFLADNGVKLNKVEILDTLHISRKYNSSLKSHKLDNLVIHYDIENMYNVTHNSFNDVFYEMEIFKRLCEQGYKPGEKVEAKVKQDSSSDSKTSTPWYKAFQEKAKMSISTEELIEKLKGLDSYCGKNICVGGVFTYHSQDEVYSIIEKLGSTPQKTVTKKTDVLFCTELKGAKYTKAVDYGIDVVTESEIIEKIK